MKSTDIVVVATKTAGKSDVIAYYGARMECDQHVNSVGATGGHLGEECGIRGMSMHLLSPNDLARLRFDTKQLTTTSGDRYQ